MFAPNFFLALDKFVVVTAAPLFALPVVVSSRIAQSK
jgi:hypothetical protein